MTPKKSGLSHRERILALVFWILLGFLFAVGLALQQPAVSLEPSRISPLPTELASIEPGINPSEQDFIANLEQQGQNLYQVGNFEAAAKVWKVILDRQTDKLKQVIALGNLSLCLQKLGRWQEANIAIQDSLALLNFLPEQNDPQILKVSAQALNIQANLYFSQGQYANALETWQASETQYQQIQDLNGITQSKLNQAQALQELGLYRRAEKILTEVENDLQTQPNSPLKVSQLRHLSNVLRVLGKLGDLDNLEAKSCTVLEQNRLNHSELSAGSVLSQALAAAQQLQSAEDINLTQFSLGNTARAIYHQQKELDDSVIAEKAANTALNCYQKAANSSVKNNQIRSKLNHFSLLLELEEWMNSLNNPDFSNKIQSEIEFKKANWQEIEAEVNTLDSGRTAVYARLDLAQSLMKLMQHDPVSTPALTPEIEGLLITATQQSENLGDPRIQSYALGYLGQLYEQLQQWENAKQYTQNALLLAQSIQADEISYQWQWQLGRIFKNQQPSHPQNAIAAYNKAVQTLQSLRQDLVAVRQDVQFDFRDRVEPVYRELVDLLLQPQTPSLDNLKQAREVIENLQLAELDNFFRDACLEAQPQPIDQIDPNAVVIYGIILTDRLEIIASFSQDKLFHYRTILPKAELTQLLKQLRFKLQKPYADQEIQQLSKQVYRWLLEPLQPQLKGNETLVFVLDDELRNIPMAALYDGQKYLIEQHPVAIQPGLQLLDPKPLILPLNALSAGLVYPPECCTQLGTLPNVPQELQKIKDVVVDGEQILNEEFNQDNLEQQVNSIPFQVIHFATHGQFSSQAEKTFILAADGPINIKQLDNLVRSREQNQTHAIDLLVLSACETAPGDNRAVLGLAGVAVRAGARSTIASLWSLSDKSAVEFMGHFYEQLVQGVSRAEALRQAQLAFLKDKDQYDAPIYWAPYILVGNWR